MDDVVNGSKLINGVVFTSNIVDSNMRSNIDNPFIMLLSVPLEYQRVQYKFSSIDQV